MAGRIYPRYFPVPITPSTCAGAQAFLLAAAKRLVLPVLCLGGFALRLHLLSAWPFREDEAMYSVWALHLWRIDPWALTVWPDKPPLFLWLLGAAFQFFGPSEAAGRLVNIAADTLTIGVVAATGRVLWNRQAGLFVAAAYALNPFAISFAPTAYTDPTLVLWGSLALYAGVTRRAFSAGLCLAAAIATKQQGLFYVPLVVGMILITHSPFAVRHSPFAIHQVAGVARIVSRFTFHAIRNTQYAIRNLQSPISNLLFGFALLFLPILLWDAARWSVAPSPWNLSVRNYAPLVLLPPGEWAARALQWGRLSWFLAGSWVVIGYWILGIGYWGVASRRQIPNIQYPIPILFFWSFGFVSLHIVSSVQIWDRYLLPLAPFLALLFGWTTQHLTGAQTERKRGASGLFLRTCQVLGVTALLFLLPPALTAAKGGLPVGADHGDYAGLSESIAWLQANAPADAVVYHRDVGWQLRFAFFAGSPAQPDASDFDLRWFPNAVYLADNAAKTAERRKFLIEPTWAVVDSAVQRLQQREIGWQIRLRAANFTLYELISPPAQSCDWCVCVDRRKRPVWSWPRSLHSFVDRATPPVLRLDYLMHTGRGLRAGAGRDRNGAHPRAARIGSLPAAGAAGDGKWGNGRLNCPLGW
ncbi:MAG: glycosyltransferase family 39 protein [Chloroflexi bacterium]|nr:glycosyltransferase family 39 protein [Chloroflexota bacterium]